jgi:glutaredoxin
MKKIMNFLQKKEDNIIMFTSSNCSYCAKAKEACDEAGVKYIEKDIQEHPAEWHDVVATTGMPVTPALLYKGDYLMPARDFPNPEILIKILKDYKSVGNDKATFERLKTLNHHINQAFNSLDGRLKIIESELLQLTKKPTNGKSKNTKKAKK